MRVSSSYESSRDRDEPYRPEVDLVAAEAHCQNGLFKTSLRALEQSPRSADPAQIEQRRALGQSVWELARERIERAAQVIITWWSDACPEWLRREWPASPELVLASAERDQRLLAQRVTNTGTVIAQRKATVDDVEAQIAAIDEQLRHAHIADMHQQHVAAQAAAQRKAAILAAEVAAAAAERAKTAAEASMAVAQAEFATAEQISDPVRPKTRRAERPLAQAQDEEQRHAIRVKLTKVHKIILDEARYPIAFAEESGAIVASYPCRHAAHARVVATHGLFNSVEWDTDRCERQALAVMQSFRPAIAGRGQPPKHIGHIVLARPTGAERWSDDEAHQAGRLALIAQGADPDRHPWFIVAHSQRTSDGAHKDEEALHLVWVRVREDDRALHNCDHALVALNIGQARWDHWSGIDPGRMHFPDGKSQPVRAGLKKVDAKKLDAYYTMESETGGKRRVVERVLLQGRVHGAKVGAEGQPVEGQCGGLWIPKPCYRNDDELVAFLGHLLRGD